MATITITTNDNNMVAEAKQKAFQKMADNLDIDVIQKLADLSTNKKAINTLKNPPTLLKSVLGIK